MELQAVAGHIAKPKSSLAPVVLGLIALSYCIWILSLPLFPTQDGPMHLYYVRIMQAILLHHDPGLFPKYFTIKHLLPPYSLYYYLLLFLGQFVSLITADKLVICLYVILFLFGFRFLAQSIGSGSDVVALLATTLVLNWSLGMGFVNFCLSTSIALWTIGLWCRAAQMTESHSRAVRLAIFVLLCWTVMLTHPVPLLGVLGFCWLEVAIRFLRRKRYLPPSNASTDGEGRLRLPMFGDVVTLLFASTAIVYVSAFTQHAVLRQTLDDTAPNSVQARTVQLMLLGKLAPFGGRGIAEILNRGCLLLVLVFALALGLQAIGRSIRAGQWALDNTWTALSLLLCVAIPILPPDLNNSHFFSARLVLYVWIAGLIGSSGVQASLLRPSFIRCAAVFALLFAAFTLFLAIRRINPIARDIARSEDGPTHDPAVGLLMRATDYRGSSNLTYDPYLWAGARVFRRTGSIIYNTPWLDLQIITVGALPIMPTGKIDARSLEMPGVLRRTMYHSLAARTLVFSNIDMALINHGMIAAGDSQDPIFSEDPRPAVSWVCHPWLTYSTCTDKEAELAGSSR
jgi:hypothetical protein